jgi:hypothetical protein
MSVRDRLIQLSDGMLIEEDTLKIVERIHEYDANLSVRYLNPAVRDSVGDAPYAIFERCTDGLDRLVFAVWQLDNTVLERIWQADSTKHDILKRMTDSNMKIDNNSRRKYQEEREEAHDITSHILNSPKGQYSIKNGDVKITVSDSVPTKIEVK